VKEKEEAAAFTVSFAVLVAVSTMTPQELAQRFHEDAHLIHNALEILQEANKCPAGLEWMKNFATQAMQDREGMGYS
jgi:hypothetical protein